MPSLRRPSSSSSSNHFCNLTAAYLYGSQVTATAPFFSSPDASLHTYPVTATVKHENPSQRNQSVHPGKLLKPPHFPVDVYFKSFRTTSTSGIFYALSPSGWSLQRKPQRAVKVSYTIFPVFSLLFPDCCPSSIYSPAILCLFF